jgi:hypothetical protein
MVNHPHRSKDRLPVYVIRVRTTDGIVWLDEDRWSRERSRATRYPTHEAAEGMARWFLHDLRGTSPKLLGWTILED